MKYDAQQTIAIMQIEKEHFKHFFNNSLSCSLIQLQIVF
jgi:hypothetical protein